MFARRPRASCAIGFGLSYHCESLENRVLLSSLNSFLSPAPIAAPADPQISEKLAVTDASYPEYRDLALLAQSTTPAQRTALDRVDSPLLVLYSRALQKTNVSLTREPFTGGAYADYFNVSDDGARPVVQAFVKDVPSARAALEQLGMQVSAVTDTDAWHVVAGYLPVGSIGSAADVPGLVHLSAVERPQLNASGSVSNQWETVSFADQLKRNLPGIDGTNIDVGIISDTMNRVGTGVAGSQATGDLPPGGRVSILQEGPASGATDEGRAMSELVYDMGSGFDILFHSGFLSPADMAQGFTDLRVAGADVIADDISWLGEPYFQDGQIATSIDSNVNAGTLCFTSASNQEDSSYQHAWQNFDADGFYDFASGDETVNFTLSNNEQLRCGLQWNQAFGSATTDLDVQIWNSSLTTLLADTNTNNIGGNPFDFMSFTNTTGGTASFHLAIEKVSGPDPGVIKFISFNNADDFTDPYVLNQPGIPGNNAANLGFTMGAVFQGTPNTIESFSSRGPNTIYFTAGGTPISPVNRQKPDFTAADGCSTSVPGFASFFGTSAASPNAAAVAGLMLQIAGGAGSLNRTQVFNIFRDTAVGTNAGLPWDAVHGLGRISALGAGMDANGRIGTENYLELNQFGDASGSSDLFANSDIDSWLFASDDSGTFTVTTSESSSPFNAAEILWNADSNAFIDIAYDTIGQNPQVSFSGSFWAHYQADIFNEANISSAGPYTISVNGPTQAIGSLALNSSGSTSVNSSIDHIADPDFYSVTAPLTSNGLLTVTLTPAAALDGVVSLYDSSGALLARQDSAFAGGAETINFSGVTPGASYAIRVASYHYATQGDYALAVNFGQYLPTITTTIETVMIPFGPTGIGIDTYAGFISMDGIGDIDYDVFAPDDTLSNNLTITATAGAGSAVDPMLGIYNADTGAVVAFDTDSGTGNAARINFIGSVGTRYILAVGDQQSDSTGKVDVTVNYGGTNTGAPVPLNASGSGSWPATISPQTDTDFFNFTTPASGFAGTGTVTFTPSASLAADVFVFDSTGNLLRSDFNNAAGAVVSIPLTGLTTSTTYYITVNPSMYSSTGTGTVSVNLDIGTPAPGAPDLDASSDTGISSTDNITRDNTPTFIGTALPNATVRLYRGATMVGSGVANGSGSWSITTAAAQPDGTFNFTVTQETTGAESAHSPALSVTIDTVAPTLAAATVFNLQKAPQNLEYQFSEDLGSTLGTADISIADLTHGGTIATASLAASFNSATHIGRFTWPGLAGGILPDANFEAKLTASGITDVAGNTLAAGNVFDFFFLSGDANHDRHVDVTDLGILATNWQGNNKTFGQADFNYDTHVDVTDLGILATQWQKFLAPAGPAPVVNARTVSPIGRTTLQPISATIITQPTPVKTTIDDLAAEVGLTLS